MFIHVNSYDAKYLKIKCGISLMNFTSIQLLMSFMIISRNSCKMHIRTHFMSSKNGYFKLDFSYHTHFKL